MSDQLPDGMVPKGPYKLHEEITRLRAEVERLTKPGKFRVGSKVKLNVYEGDQPIFQCHTSEEAERIVALLNSHSASEWKLKYEGLLEYCDTIKTQINKRTTLPFEGLLATMVEALIAKYEQRDTEAQFNHSQRMMANAQVDRCLAERDSLGKQLEAANKNIDGAWFGIEHGWDIEPREYFEENAPKSGDWTPLQMAVHYMWKRDRKVEALANQLEKARKALTDLPLSIERRVKHLNGSFEDASDYAIGFQEGQASIRRVLGVVIETALARELQRASANPDEA